jgi:cytoskeletal protein CcmA (bactofilin family)/DNA-directed RNA polymerase subunit RPC12/RpoP
MPAKGQHKVSVSCPHCGHTQTEPASAFSTTCKQCHQYYRVQDVLNPKEKRVAPPKEIKRVACFECGAELEAPAAAQSTSCKKCGRHVDLKDYEIDKAVSKNFRTAGRFVVEEDGFVFNTDSIVGEAVIKGKFHGRLVTERALEIYTTAIIQGSFKAGRLVVPEGNRFRWEEELKVGGAEIGGELVANLRSEGCVTFKSKARFFGDVRAKHLVIEDGAVFVGSVEIGE